MTDTQRAGADAHAANAGRGRRHWKNFFVKPGFRFKYTWYFIAAGLLIFGVTAALIERRVSEVVALANSQPIQTFAQQGYVTGLLVEITKISLVGFSVYLIFSFLLAFLVSHRVSGPQVALADIIAQFKRGNYAYRRPLRQRDELKQIHHELLELGEILEGSAGERAGGVPSSLSVVDARTRRDS